MSTPEHAPGSAHDSARSREPNPPRHLPSNVIPFVPRSPLRLLPRPSAEEARTVEEKGGETESSEAEATPPAAPSDAAVYFEELAVEETPGFTDDRDRLAAELLAEIHAADTAQGGSGSGLVSLPPSASTVQPTQPVRSFNPTPSSMYTDDPLAFLDSNASGDGMPDDDFSEVEPPTHPTLILAGPWPDTEVINRDPRGLSPFAPIVKTENYAENSGNLTGYSVEVKDPTTPTGFRHLGNVSASYLLLSNLECHEVAMEVATRSGLDYRPTRVFFDGGRYMEIVEFVGTEYEVETGDPVRLCLVLKNSYNKAWPLEATLAAVRMVCLNGMIAGTHFQKVRFKHVVGNLGGRTLSEVVGQAMRVLDHADTDLRKFVEGLRRLKALPATHKAMREVRNRVLTPDAFGSQKWGEVLDRFYRHEEPSLYGLLNAATYATWHGKVSAADVRQNEAAVSGLLTYAESHRN